MSDQLIVERGGLESKDKTELQTIVAALGGKVSPRVSKATLIDEIMNLSSQTSVDEPESESEPETESEVSESAEEAPEAEVEANNKAVEVSDPQPNVARGRQQSDDDNDGANARRRGRRGRRGEREEAGNDPVTTQVESVEGFLDLRDEGYGFLRVNGFLPSKEDVYVSVKQVRQLSLRKGDHLAGLSMPAHRNEKNPCFEKIETVNGSMAEGSANRPSFEDLTPVFPNEQIILADENDPEVLTTRCLDLFAPIGKGQRGFIVAPPKAGKTTFIKDIANSIQANNSDIGVLVLSIDGRPEEVTEMYNHLKEGEIVASAFDKPADEHIAVAELTFERAKRLAETGEDVFIIVDNMTQLARAYQIAAANSSRSQATGLDISALHPIKKLLGGAVNLEGSGSLTVIATMSIETGSPIDDEIYESLKSTVNMELKLDGSLAQHRIFPAIDPVASFTSNDGLLRDPEDSETVQQARDLIEEMFDEDDGNIPGVEKLLEKMINSKTNSDFLNEISKKGSL